MCEIEDSSKSHLEDRLGIVIIYPKSIPRTVRFSSSIYLAIRPTGQNHASCFEIQIFVVQHNTSVHSIPLYKLFISPVYRRRRAYGIAISLDWRKQVRK